MPYFNSILQFIGDWTVKKMDDKAFQNVLQMSFIIFYLKISGSRECFCSQQDYAESTKINKNKYMKREKKTKKQKSQAAQNHFVSK